MKKNRLLTDVTLANLREQFDLAITMQCSERPSVDGKAAIHAAVHRATEVTANPQHPNLLPLIDSGGGDMSQPRFMPPPAQMI
jgi:hypothetical protein